MRSATSGGPLLVRDLLPEAYAAAPSDHPVWAAPVAWEAPAFLARLLASIEAHLEPLDSQPDELDHLGRAYLQGLRRAQAGT